MSGRKRARPGDFARRVAQPDTAWFDTADVAAGSGVDPARVYEALRALEQVGYVTAYYGGSGPCMYYATTKARREAVQGG